MDSPGAAHDNRLHVMSKEVESTIEYVCKIGAYMEETHDQVGVRKQLKRKRFSQKYTGLIQRWGDINSYRKGYFVTPCL